MDIQDVINELRDRRRNFPDITEFSPNPGIYAIFCNSGRLPHIDRQIPESEIIYVGMTTVSQEARDANTHFASGRTGSSTVRRSLGALLRDQLSLTPIPRNTSKAEKKYKFDKESEVKLTDWMVANLALSYYDYRESKSVIERLEERIIKTLVPIINLDKNPENPYKELVSGLRSECGSIAKLSQESQVPHLEGGTSGKDSLVSGKKQGKYVDLWNNNLTAIQKILESPTSEGIVNFTEKEFQTVGNRSKYSFRLEMAAGKVSNNIGGSAVARDLARSLGSSSEIMAILRAGSFVLRLDGDFFLNIARLD